MSVVIQKTCPRPGCGATYNEDFISEYCDVCGATLLVEEVVMEEVTDIFETLDTTTPKVGKKQEDNLSKVEEAVDSNNETDFKDIDTKEIETKDEESTSEDTILNNKTIFTIDSLGYIHFIESTDVEELNEDKIVIYLGNQVYKEIPLEYDEMIIGRHSVNSEPDVDLSPIDPEGYTSRRHLMIYKENDKFFARNLSTKNSVHVERDVLGNGDSKELNDNDLILLSKYVVMVFKRKQ